MVEKRTNKTAEQLREESKKNDLAERGKIYANKKIAKSATVNKALEVKRTFEEKMNQFRDSAEESARKPPLRQEYGESDAAFLKRQRDADKTGPENPQRMSLKDAAKQQAKDYGKKQLKKGTDFAKRKASDYLARNPKVTEAVEKAKMINSRAKAIQQKVIDKKKFVEKIAKEKAKKLARKAAMEVAKKTELATQVAKEVAQFALRIAISFIVANIEIIVIIIAVIIIIVIVIAALKYTCESNSLFDAACFYFVGM